MANNTLDAFIETIDPHEVNRQDVIVTPVFLLATAATFIVESILLYITLYQSFPILLGMIVHGVVVWAIYFYGKTLQRNDFDCRFVYLMSVMTLVLGPFGSAGVLLSKMLTLFYTRHAQTFSEWFISIFPKAYSSLPETLYENMQTGRDISSRSYSVIPFLDVMAIGSEAQKREALSKMTLMFNPIFAPAFRKALSDPSNAIRVQAATAVTRIENQFLERSMRIQEVLKRYPNNPQVKLALARHYDDYAYTGVLDEEREHHNRVLALESYMEYLKSRPDDVQVRLYVGRLLMRSNDIQEAANWFSKCLAEKFLSGPIVFWYMECLFRLNRFRELRGIASTYYALLSQNPSSSASNRDELHEVVRLWVGDYSVPGTTVSTQTPSYATTLAPAGHKIYTETLGGKA